MEAEFSIVIGVNGLQGDAATVLCKELDMDTLEATFFAIANAILVMVAVNITVDSIN
mgnify:CR=1 FL=1